VSELNYSDKDYVPADFRTDRLNNAMVYRKLTENLMENIQTKFFEALK
jgi:hypothetical protein